MTPAATRYRLHRPGWRDLLLAALSGAGIALGQAPFELWYLALPSLAALIWFIVRRPAPLAAAWLGWFGGAGYFALALVWIIEPFLVDVARHGWMAPFAVVILAFGMALFWGLAAGAAAGLGRTVAGRALALAVTLALGEALRSYVLTGFPWALIGHIWIGTPVMQLAALVGPLGLTLLTTATAATPAALLERSRGAALAGAVGAALVLGAVAAWGMQRLAVADPPRAAPLVVRIVQPNAPQAEKWQEDRARMFLDRMLALTAARATPMPDVVIWPESAVPYLLRQSDPVLALVAKASQGVPVILGINRDDDRRYFNSMVVTGPRGEVAAVYDKHHLTPFGEYLPFGDLLSRFGVTGFAARDGNGFSPGPGAVGLDLGRLGRVLPLICYEAVFPQDLRTGGPRPDWIVQITNDAWFGSFSGPYQHLAQARLRAVEQGLPLVRSANTGISAVIDARGRVLHALPLNTVGYFDLALPPALAPTRYAVWGDQPMLVLLAFLASALVLARMRKTD